MSSLTLCCVSDPEQRKVYDERGEKGVTGEDKDMTDGGEEGGGGGCSGCCCGAKSYIEKFGFAAYAAMTGMISDSEGEEESEPEEDEEEEEDDEVQAVGANGVNVNGMGRATRWDGPPMNGQQMGMNGQPMNIVRPMGGNPMNVRPMYGNPRQMYGNPRPLYGNPAMNVRPIFNVNNAGAQMGIVRPIIVNGQVVGTYVAPVNPNVRPQQPSASPSSAAGAPSADKRKIVEVEDEIEGSNKRIWKGGEGVEAESKKVK